MWSEPGTLSLAATLGLLRDRARDSDFTLADSVESDSEGIRVGLGLLRLANLKLAAVSRPHWQWYTVTGMQVMMIALNFKVISAGPGV
jgi:hypothetical protein